MQNKIRVLIVDDSSVVRRVLTQMLSNDPLIDIVGTASDPYEAKDKILSLNPDVLTLDIEMPRMDGLTFLKILMEEHPLPAVILSSLSQENSAIALKALEIGAMEVMAKPNGSDSVSSSAILLKQKIKNAFAAKGRINQTLSGQKATPKALLVSSPMDMNKVILLGASTGGTEALKEVLVALPNPMPPIVIVQHIPPIFSKAFAERLDQACLLKVKEAQDGDVLKAGEVLIAPGNYHMKLIKSPLGLQVALNQTPQVWHQRPAVDILFQSGAEILKQRAVAALLTGMGKDGANGLLALKQAGGYTLAQDEKTSVVYGMPKAAADIGAAMEVLPLQKIASALTFHCCSASKILAKNTQ
jgi:two-component system chemotaxis response regulator CheB